jgi:uncharacterized protein YozE (UPF0346 family)
MISWLEKVVNDYIENEMQKSIHYIKDYKMKSKKLSYDDYVKKAIVFFGDHMWPVERFNQVEDFKLVAVYLKLNNSKISNCKSFDEIIKFISNAKIKNFGELAKYDKSLAMGIYFDLMPDKVFVHAGPRYALQYILAKEYDSKIKILKGTNNTEYIEVCDLPSEFDKLKDKPYLIEICLCYIYKYLKSNNMIK